MTNEVGVQIKETEKDDYNFSAASDTKILEITLIGEVKNEISLKIDKEIKSKQQIFSSIFKENENLQDEDLYF